MFVVLTVYTKFLSKNWSLFFVCEVTVCTRTHTVLAIQYEVPKCREQKACRGAKGDVEQKTNE